MANEQKSAELDVLLRSDTDQQAYNIDQFSEYSDGENLVSETHDEPIATPEYIASPVRSGSRERNALAPRGSDVPETESDSSDSEEDERREAEDLGRHKQDKLEIVLDGGNIDDISEVLTPKALANCDKNALMTAMKASYELRNLSRKKGPSEEDFASLANSVDQFSFSLLDPLKSNDEARHVLGDSIDDILDSAINWEQKRLLTHPVIFNLMADKWVGQFGKLRSSSLVVERLQWIFLNVWCLFDSLMFPVLFALFWTWSKIFGDNQKLKTRGMEVAFLINKTSDLPQETFTLMKDTVQKFIEEHGDEQTKYQIIIHGKKPKKRYHDEARSGLRSFGEPGSYATDRRPKSQSRDSQPEPKPKEVRAKDVKDLQNGDAVFPALHRNLKMADEYFFAETRESSVGKVIIYLTDHKTSLRRKVKRVKRRARDLGKKRGTKIKLLPVGIGPHIDIRELEKVTKENNQDLNVIHAGEYENSDTIRKIIWRELHGKCVYESYWDYFTTPYFVFVRDTVSYFALVALHFAICLSPSTVPLSGLEWAILMFFLGRMLMEIQQITTIKKRKKESECRVTRSTTGKYLSDGWNVLDFITLVIYLLTFFLRTITWGLSTSTINNRAIVAAGYLYGVNTMLLTLRSFGQVMETSKGVGVVQIALFQMFGDITTIFWQFIAAILAFSIAITKVYMAERSYISKENNIKQGLVCETSGLSCWWTMMKHLCWSLLGLAELDPLDSIDHTSMTIAHFLFGVFLVVGVILLVNMMIALLNNTYEKVQGNALREWSFRKAITLQTYSDYHPIPVPFNIGFWCWWLFCSRCCKGCIRDFRGCKGDSFSEKKRRSFDFVVTDLQNVYFATYGNFFPVTNDGNKIDHIFQETKQNKRIANHISYETFLSSVFGEGALPVGQEAWDSSGITVDGCRLTYQGKEICKTCKENVPMIYHGARYRLPFSREYPHFEVLIQESGRFVGVGVVWKSYGNHAMPGLKDGTVGYIVNQGKVFGPCLPEKGLEYENAIAYRGDVIGCRVEFGNEENPDEVEIIFTLNGRPISQEKILMPYNMDYCEDFFVTTYPYICMTTCSTTVLAKMCSSKCVSPNGQIETENIMAITQMTSNINDTVNSKFEATDEVVQRCETTMSNSLAEVEKFMNDVTGFLEVLEHFLVSSQRKPLTLKEKDRRNSGNANDDELIIRTPSTICESAPAHMEEEIETEHQQYLSRKDGGGLGDLQPPTDPLKKICDDLEKVDNTTRERFSSLLKRLENLEDKFQGETEENKEKRRKIQGKMQELRYLILY